MPPQFSHAFPRTLDWLNEGRRLGWHPGCQLYVSIDGTSVLDLALGDAHLQSPMTVNTLNLWFSSGKPITAVAVGQLVEQGRLDWDTSIARWIPEFGAHGKDVVELRHLLTHTGGFRSADAVPEDTSWSDTLRQISDSPFEPGALR
jgi:CubicO group peptidase (beta-lactamase class C family)